MTERQIKLGRTDGFRYLGVQPPLTMEQIASLPLVRFGNMEESIVPFSKIEYNADGSQTIGVFSWPFDVHRALSDARIEGEPAIERFVEYAQEIARQIGEVALDPEVRWVGPGSLFTQNESVDKI